MNPPPHFLIVGTMKSGTTTLADTLTQVPGIWIPEKELHFFNDEKNFTQGTNWYEDKLLKGSSRPPNGNLLVGEKTPTYSFLPFVPPRIAELYPQIRLIWIYRNPVDRTFSNYLHSYKQGADSLPFEEALLHEPERMQQSIYYAYTQRSMYAEQVKRFKAHFPETQMHHLLFEDLLQNPKTCLDRILEFLDHPAPPAYAPLPRSNATRMPRFQKPLARAFQALGPTHPGFKLIKKAANLWSVPKPRMQPETRARLQEVFRTPNEELARITGLDLSFWDR